MPSCSLYERGLAYVSNDWNCAGIWDKYIDFEQSKSEWGRVAQLYTRILQMPNANLDKYFERFKEFASAHPLPEILTPEEAVELSAPEPAPPAAGDDDGVPAGEEEPKPEKTELEKLEQYIGMKEVLYRASKERVDKIKEYEIQIKRPYFHIKPLDETQLNTWHKYLDFIEKEGDFVKIVHLYERCVIPGANYPEFWIRYVERMESMADLERAMEVLGRATGIFLKRRPEIHLFAAKLKEQLGDLHGAQAEFAAIHELTPSLLEAVVKHANLERRLGNPSAGTEVYAAAVQAEKGKEDSRSLPFLYLQYARYVDQAVGDTDKAREVYAEALKKSPTSKNVWQATMLFEASHPGANRAKRVMEVAEQALAAAQADGTRSLTAADRDELCTMAVDFVDLYGDMATLKQAEALYKGHFPPKRGSSESKKRSAADSGAGDRSTKHHKMHGPHHGGGPYAYGQYGANYGGGYNSSWQQPSRPPSAGAGAAPPPQQAWGGGYAAPAAQAPPAQAGYGGYNSGYYAAPAQAAAPPPAQPAYSGYAPQPYAAPQAYPPQQPYAAPPTAAPAAAAQPAYYAQQGYYQQ